MRFGTAIERLVDNYQYAKSKIWIRDEVAWALYHTWKEADERKDEPSNSEKPNNCDTCKHYLFTDIDGYYCEHETYGQPCQYAPKTEPTISKMEQVEDEPQTVRSNLEPFRVDEPQTERSE